MGYRPSGAEPPGVVVATDGETRTVPLVAGERVSYTLGERRCAGVVRDGRHEPCDADRAPYCAVHESRYDPATNDARHAVYLAAFAPATFKVGITQATRLERRLREQGADRAAKVGEVSDGAVARAREEAIDEDSRLTQRVRVSQKLPGLHQSVEESPWDALLADYEPAARFDLSYGVSVTERPIQTTMLAGEVRGVQGRVALLDRAGTTYAVDLRDLVGYELREGTDDRDLQSSLGAFG